MVEQRECQLLKGSKLRKALKIVLILKPLLLVELFKCLELSKSKLFTVAKKIDEA